MASGHRYRVASIFGTVLASIVAVVVANLPGVQSTLSTTVPVVRRLPASTISGDALILGIATTIAIVLGCLLPLFKPRPRPVFDTILLTQKRVVVAGFAMATAGYFDYTYPLPRLTLALTVTTLLVLLPTWFVTIRRQPAGRERVIVVGDDPDEIHDVLEEIELPVVGYVAPPSPYYLGRGSEEASSMVTDGRGDTQLNELEYLGGLSRLDEVLVEHDVDTAALAFTQADRAEFFGALHACHGLGIQALASSKHSDTLLTSLDADDSIVEIDLDPWDWQDRLFKRLFDVAFAGTALLAVSPLVVLIAVAIRIEGHGPVFFAQERTYQLGDTFRIYKFRTLKPESSDVDLDIEDDRKTPLGQFLRKTHLDEIPQLWSILVGDMSVVGPRPAITELEPDYVSEVDVWKQRWFVKPGLTGLAQINDATGKEPARKVEYDLDYIQQQSFWFDLTIIARQFWQVFQDVANVRQKEQ